MFEYNFFSPKHFKGAHEILRPRYLLISVLIYFLIPIFVTALPAHLFAPFLLRFNC